jgi:hypothetical protein
MLLPKNSQKISLIKLRKVDVPEEKEHTKKEVHKVGKLEALMEYRDFLLFGGIVGIFSAIFSTEFLII